MVLGSVNASGKGKEIPAIKELLGSLILQEGDLISNTHGRNEIHEIWLTEELDWLGVKNDWKDLNQLILVKRTREEKGKISEENRYYIASGKNKINKIEELAKYHWFIENKYHWHLDVTFREDQSLINAKSNRNLA